MPATPARRRSPWLALGIGVLAGLAGFPAAGLASSPAAVPAADSGPAAQEPALVTRDAARAAPSPDPGAEILRRIEGAEVALDGRLDEGVWELAPRVSLDHQLRPNEGARPSESTEVRIFYDAEAIYLGVRLHEEDPGRIVNRAVERNSFHQQDQDGFALILDTNGDQRTAFGFIVNPAGARTDVAIFDEARVSWNSDWNAFWDAATSTDPQGWTLEMRIPFSSLRFQPGPDGTVHMGMTLWRYLARNNEFAVFPEIPNLWGNSAHKPGQGAPVTFRGIRPANPLYIKPYLLGGVARQAVLPPGAAAWGAKSSPTREVGVDVKYNVTSSLVLDVSVNTDFAQVEADDERFNLERFSLFFPEKRDFFQERSDLFNYRLPGGSDRLFHSRRIGIAGGVPIPLHGGARLTGRQGNWELGLLAMQTGGARAGEAGVPSDVPSDVPSESFGVLRLQRPVLDEGSYVGGLFTSRTDRAGTHNLVLGLDADLHLGGSHFVGLQAAGSLDRTGTGRDAAEGAMATVVVQRRINRGLSFGSSLSHIGADFRPGVGFVRRTGLNRLGHRTQYTWFPEAGGRLQNHSLAHRFDFLWDDRFRKLETNTTSLSWDARFRRGGSLRAEGDYTRDVLDRGFVVGGLPVPQGTWAFASGSLRVESPPGSDVRISGGIEGGGYYGGRRLGGSTEVAWTPGPRLTLALENELNRIDLPSGRRDVLISRIRVGTAARSDLTLQAFVQYNSNGQVVTPNIRIRYNPREGSDLFLVYNEALNTDLLPGDPLLGGDPRLPGLPRSQFRSVQLKYTYTFVR